jgi:hypothetical protein
MTGATFTTDGRTLRYTAEEYYRLANSARRAGHLGVGLLLMNLGDSAFSRPDDGPDNPYEVIVHPETARIVFAVGG